MSKPRDPLPVRTFSETELRGILARALELDRHPRPLTEAEVRDIAREAGVSDAAVMRAIEDQTSAGAGEASSKKRGWRRWLDRFRNGLVLGAGATTLTTIVLNNDLPRAWALAGIAALFGSVLALALRARGRYRHVGFQVGNLGIWSGVAGALAVLSPGAHYASLVPWLVGTGIAGAAIIRLRGRGRRAAEETPPMAVPTPRVGTPAGFG